jgi:isoleucyl-tRNA synthetase
MAEKDTKSDAAKREERILAWWKENQIFERSVEKPSPSGEFVFYEGPPTANGRPGIHHLESRSFKDAIPRYKTMRGYRVPRRAGWDTHGLPVELEVEKELGFSGKPDIEKYGVAAFNKSAARAF